MTTDSLNATASDDTQDSALVDTDAEDSSNAAEDATPAEPDVNTDALKASIEAARLQADVESLKRSTGHIRGMQSKLDQVERQLAKITDLEQSSQQLASRFDTLLDALEAGNLLEERATRGLRPQRGDSNAEIMAKFESLEQRLTAGPTQAEEDPAAIAFQRAADAATEQVMKYATSKGYDGNQIPDAVWTNALNTNRGDFTAAALEVMRYVEGELAKQSRRAERADAASGGVGERSARKGALTRAALDKMSVAEIRVFDRENPGVIDQVMRGK